MAYFQVLKNKKKKLTFQKAFHLHVLDHGNHKDENIIFRVESAHHYMMESQRMSF